MSMLPMILLLLGQAAGPERVVLTGTVIGPDGKPAAGAEVVLTDDATWMSQFPFARATTAVLRPPAVLETRRADADGRFRVELPEHGELTFRSKTARLPLGVRSGRGPGDAAGPHRLAGGWRARPDGTGATATGQVPRAGPGRTAGRGGPAGPGVVPRCDPARRADRSARGRDRCPGPGDARHRRGRRSRGRSRHVGPIRRTAAPHAPTGTGRRPHAPADAGRPRRRDGSRPAIRRRSNGSRYGSGPIPARRPTWPGPAAPPRSSPTTTAGSPSPRSPRGRSSSRSSTDGTSPGAASGGPAGRRSSPARRPRSRSPSRGRGSSRASSRRHRAAGRSPAWA